LKAFHHIFASSAETKRGQPRVNLHRLTLTQVVLDTEHVAEGQAAVLLEPGTHLTVGPGGYCCLLDTS